MLAVIVVIAVSALMDLIPYPHTMQGVSNKDVDIKYAVLFTVPAVLLTFGLVVWRRANETARVFLLLFAIPLSLLLEALLFVASIAR